MTPPLTTTLDELRSKIRGQITNAYYDCRNEGETMETAADRAADSVMEVLAAQPAPPTEHRGGIHRLPRPTGPRPEPVSPPSDAARAAPERVARLSEDGEGHGMALRAMGEAITEIGLRDLSGPLTDDDIAASVSLAQNVLYWAYGTEWTPEDWAASRSHAASPRPPKAGPVASPLGDDPVPRDYGFLREWDAAPDPVASPPTEALRLLRELVECVNALENRALRSGGEFHVWAEERMLTEARDEARRYLAATEEGTP